jgi:hypothetical protein
MSKSWIQLFMDFQIWMLDHIGQLYCWSAVITVISTTMYYYNNHIHHLSILPYWIIMLFLYYTSFKIVVR